MDFGFFAIIGCSVVITAFAVISTKVIVETKKQDRFIPTTNSSQNNDILLNDTRTHSSAPLHRGTLYIRIGPMFSGKTTWLNGELTQLADKGFSVLKIIHDDDIREDVESCDKSGSTHNSSYNSLSKKISIIRARELSYINVNDFHVIGIDESQFFPDLLEVVTKWVETLGKHVKVVGLDGDAFKQKFGQTLDLIPLCDEVIKINASCKVCLDELIKANFHGNILSINGPFTRRINPSTQQKLVGGSDQYIPVCRYHSY